MTLRLVNPERRDGSPRMPGLNWTQTVSNFNSAKDLGARLGEAVKQAGYRSGLFTPGRKCPAVEGRLRSWWLTGKHEAEEVRAAAKGKR